MQGAKPAAALPGLKSSPAWLQPCANGHDEDDDNGRGADKSFSTCSPLWAFIPGRGPGEQPGLEPPERWGASPATAVQKGVPWRRPGDYLNVPSARMRPCSCEYRLRGSCRRGSDQCQGAGQGRGLNKQPSNAIGNLIAGPAGHAGARFINREVPLLL